jgi:RNA polymerase sigma factor (sigma-70 family)
MVKLSERELAELLEAAAGGDARAYGEVVRRFQRMAVAYAYGVLGDFHLAEDAAQEAFVEAYGRLGELRVRNAFASWLRRIVYKHCDREIRKRRPSAMPDAAGEKPDNRTPVRAVAQAEERGLVEAALGALPRGERAAVTMFYMEERSHREIAEFLGTTPGAVKSRLHSARERLKARLVKMAADEIKRHTPDDAFARRVEDAIKVFTAPGPAENQIGNAWNKRVLGKIGELLDSGEEGFRVAVELSRCPQAKARVKAALHFGLCGDARGREHLERLLTDASSAVRRRALVSYALLISPVGADGRRFGAENLFSRRATSIPESVDKLATLLDDPDVKNRWNAVLALAPYALLGDATVESALSKAFGDESHKVCHSAALALNKACPDCGRRSRD